MKVTVEVNGKPVEIELTPDQVQKVKKHTEKITDRVKTFEDACEVLGQSVPLNMHVVDKLKLIADALNEGWKADWNDTNQYKYFPYFKWNDSKFVCHDYYLWYSPTNVGSRLCFKNSDLAIYIAKQFEDLYNEFLQG